ncbi:DUF309 domain-containing protein [Mycolicibacterium sp. S2-37]|uniref:DUF309 domain-containing protein n=1 Tax=Mycolicibacterium sp. S2-37 TaxID=2810297 RepID=UPI001A94673A|nr:DUF309 domain-containing protein [Mycolicibacterium sp. S2-37]MBO0677934.1 DUF309 domain-containing protein [Mycolicibacterium sp. S2-37]
MAERDRDDAGRPRNTRPRDALGRPLPPGSPGVARIPDDLHLPPAESLTYAQDLVDRGRAFHAHEVLEAAWKDGPGDEKPLWQGLAQLMVGITHVQRGNHRGARALLVRGSERLGAFRCSPPPHGIDVAGLIAFAADLIADLDAGVDIAGSRLHPKLTVDS